MVVNFKDSVYQKPAVFFGVKIALIPPDEKVKILILFEGKEQVSVKGFLTYQRVVDQGTDFPAVDSAIDKALVLFKTVF